MPLLTGMSYYVKYLCKYAQTCDYKQQIDQEEWERQKADTGHAVLHSIPVLHNMPVLF